jgi:hypothetical protein
MENARTLTKRLTDLLARERTALGEFLVALADFDAKRFWLALGYGSLFDFLHRELGLSKASASFRKKAAELLQRFPDLVEPIQDGRLCLTSVFELAKVLTPENRDEVLPRFFQLSRREAKAVVAELQPAAAPAMREVVTAIRAGERGAPGAASGTRALLPPVECPNLDVAGGAPEAICAPAGDGASDFTSSGLTGRTRGCQLSVPAPTGAPSAVPETSTDPLTAELSRMHVTVSRRFLDKLEKARAALSHSHPGAGADEILEAGLDLLIERHEKRRGIVEKPRKEPPPSGPDHVPAHVKRAVWRRDGGRCQWPLEGGGVCGSTFQVELDHVTPRGKGGLATVDAMRCLCRPHNLLAARGAYGDEWMDRFVTGARPRVEQAAPAP